MPAPGAEPDWLHPRDAGPGIPSQPAAVTSRAGSAAQGCSAGAAGPRREGRRWEFPGKHCSRWPAWLRHRDTSAARPGKGIFGKSLLAQVQLVLIPPLPPSLPPPNVFISPQLHLFLERRFLLLLQASQSTSQCSTLGGPSLLLFVCLFLSDFTLLSASYSLQAVKVA